MQLPSLFILLVSALPVWNASALTSDELVQRAIDCRVGLRSGHLLISHSYNQYHGSGDGAMLTKTYDIDFDGKSVRSIVTYAHPNWTKVTKTVFTDSLYISDWWKNEPVSTGPYGKPKQVAQFVTDAFDPRLLGLVPVDISLLNGQSIDRPFFFSRNKSTAPIPDKIDSQDTFRIDYEVTPESHVRLWIAPEFGYSVLRLERENGLPGKKNTVLTVLASKFAKSEKSGPWFPSEVTRSQFFGETLVEEEVTRVNKAQFNMDIQPTVFSFKGLDIEPGRKVLQTGGRQMIWTGFELIDQHVGDNPLTESDMVPHRSGAIQWMWTINALVFGIVLCGMLVRFMRNRARAASS